MEDERMAATSSSPLPMRIWMIASPVASPSSLVPETWCWLYGLNPMAGVIKGFRWPPAGKGDPPGRLIFVSAAAVAVVLLSGLAYFQEMEPTIADVV